MPSFRQHRVTRTLGLAAFAIATVVSLAQEPTPSPTAPKPAPKPISARQRRAADDAYLAGARQLSHNDPTAAEQSFAHAVLLDPAKPEYALSLAVAKEHHVTA